MITLTILNAAHEPDRQRWLDVWHAWPKREVLAHPAYVQLFAPSGAQATCALLEDAGRAQVLFPFIMRAIAAEPWARPEGGDAWDITTPYGYGGPFVLSPNACLAQNFWDRFDAWAQERCVITAFARLSLFGEQLVPFRGEVIENRPNVVRRLDLSEDDLWRDVAHKVRKNVNRARSCSLQVEIDQEGHRLDEFLNIYTATMERREAGSGYYFPRSFFERVIRDLAGQFVFFHVISAATVVSTELVLVSADNIYSFLGGTMAEAFELRPNDLLKYELIRWGIVTGKKAFVLGGGYQESDGIYRYKLSFAPDGQTPFFVGTRVFDEDGYQKLLKNRLAWEATQGRSWTPIPGFFPPYRG